MNKFSAGPTPEAQRVSDESRRKRREEVQRVAESNRRAHEQAKKDRQDRDRYRAQHRGPNPR